MFKSFLLTILIYILLPFIGYAQEINGIYIDRETKQVLANVQTSNIYNNTISFSDSAGRFSILAQSGELLEIKLPGYITTSVRIPKGHIPSFFKLYLDQVAAYDTNRFANSALNTYQIDSIKNREYYNYVLSFPKMSFAEKMESPFSAMSRSNQLKWQFQDNFAKDEKEKFIDFNFNKKLIQQITNLDDEQIIQYMRQYRPSYELLRSLSLYEFYKYIQITGERFKKRSKPNVPRNSG